jgi:hypothetical protein
MDFRDILVFCEARTRMELAQCCVQWQGFLLAVLIL